MPPLFRPLRRPFHAFLLVLLVSLLGCSAGEPTRPSTTSAPTTKPRSLTQPAQPTLQPPTQPSVSLPATLTPPRSPATLATPSGSPTKLPSFTFGTSPEASTQVLLGIDVLEKQGFDAVKGKRVGLLTHAAGVNRRGVSTIDVLRKAPGVKLVALYAVEHGLYGDLLAEKPYPDRVDPRTGLMVYSLYNGKATGRWASPAQLAPIDVLVIDLQDIGSRSYTYVSAMRYALESCFKVGKEVIVLDRPNPLGGLKVSGPILDAEWLSYVGAYRIPYVHGLTIGELAKMAKETPGTLQIPENIREKGRLTVIPMQGWKRSMRWPDTGLRWVPTSPMVQDYAAVMGYPLTGLGTYLGGFRHGVGTQYAFRGIYHKTVPYEVIEREIKALRIPGLRFQKVSAPGRDGKPATGMFIEIIDWDEWDPTELNFHLMRLACKHERVNPFLATPQGQLNGFLRHMGSNAFLEALRRDGAKVDVEAFLRDWRSKCQSFQAFSHRFWLYN